MKKIQKILMIPLFALATVYQSNYAVSLSPSVITEMVTPAVSTETGFITSAGTIIAVTALAFTLPIVAKTVGEMAQEIWKKGKDAVIDIYKSAPKIAATSTLLISAKAASSASSQQIQLCWTIAALISAGVLAYLYTPPPALKQPNEAPPSTHVNITVTPPQR